MKTPSSPSVYSKLKGLVIGCGSIGRRHTENLFQLGCNQVMVTDQDKEKLSALTSQYPAKTFTSLERALESNPDFAVVASPTSLHLSHATALAKAGIPFFVEKPVASESEGLSKLVRLVEKTQLTTLVGCNMRFHPGPKQVFDLLQQQKIGKVYFARIHSGSYLPEWRPNQDYRESYSAKASLGGGCLLDCIHEIDLAHWYLGPAVDIFCQTARLSQMEIDVEDTALLICRHESGALSQIELDYVQRFYDRGCHIAGDKGSITWDFNRRTVVLRRAGSITPENFPEPDGWKLNQMYLDSMKHFLDCVLEKKTTMNPLSQAARVLNTVLTAKKSSVDQKMLSPT